jgi:F0F1-type ATP synthase assembly protein I
MNSKKSPSQPPSAMARQLGLLSVISGILIGYTGAGVGLGYLAFAKLGFPYLTLVITGLIGFGLAMVRIYQVAKLEEAFERKNKETEDGK